MTLICSVCGQDLEIPMHSSREKCATKCGHIFHMECITNAWAPHIPTLLLVSGRLANLFLRRCYFPCPVCGTLTRGPYVMRVFPTSSAPAENLEAPQPVPVVGSEPIVEFVTEDGAPLNIGAHGFTFEEQLEDISDLISRSGSGPGEAQRPAPEERARDAAPGHSGAGSHSVQVQALNLGQNLNEGTNELGEQQHQQQEQQQQQQQAQQRKRQRVAAVGKGISKGKKQERKRK